MSHGRFDRETLLATLGALMIERAGAPTFRVTRVAGPTREILGCSQKDGPLALDEGIESDDHTWLEGELTRACEQRRSFVLMYRVQAADGDFRWVKERGFASPEGVQSVLTDVTETQTLRHHLERKQRLDGLGRLVGAVAHDVNNLVSIILALSELAEESLPEDAEARPDLVQIRRTARRAGAVMGRLLAFARSQDPAPQAVELDDVIRQAEPLLARAVHPGGVLSLDLDASKAPVRLDPRQLEQILLNLVINARDALDERGLIQIATRRLEDPARVQLTVSDSGSGIQPEIARRIFEPFFTTKGEQGTGLGLSIVKGMVERWGGLIRARSEIGRGTSMEMEFPMATEPPTPRPLSSIPPPLTADQVPETILLVEDDATLRRTCDRLLCRRGYHVLSAGSVQDALRIADEHGERIDLLLTDVSLGDGQGPELAGRLVARHPKLRVLWMTGFEPPPNGETPRSWLCKPFSPGDLVRAVRTALARVSASRVGDVPPRLS